VLPPGSRLRIGGVEVRVPLLAPTLIAEPADPAARTAPSPRELLDPAPAAR